jgi:predicted  nucleic acid-binding Zn-ribbon protein
MKVYCECGHSQTSHDGWLRGCFDCGCKVFLAAEDQTPPRVEPEVDPQEARMERIAVALESIARSLDAMRRDGR